MAGSVRGVERSRAAATHRREGVVEAEALLQEAGLLLGEPELLGAVRPAGAGAPLLLVLLHAAHRELLLLAAARRLVHVQVPHGVPAPAPGVASEPALWQTNTYTHTDDLAIAQTPSKFSTPTRNTHHEHLKNT